MSFLSTLFQEPWLALVMVIMFLTALSIHEFSHALAGYLLGDMTAKRLGRLTLNPTAHVDVWGFLSLLLIGFGWGKPVPFNPYNLKYPRWGPVMVAAAGPFSNLVLGIVFSFMARGLEPMLGSTNLLLVALWYGAYLNFLLMIFNLIPLPPLDGSKAVLAILADERYRLTRFWLETKGPQLLMILIIADIALGLGVFSFIGWGAASLLRLFGG